MSGTRDAHGPRGGRDYPYPSQQHGRHQGGLTPPAIGWTDRPAPQTARVFHFQSSITIFCNSPKTRPFEVSQGDVHCLAGKAGTASRLSLCPCGAPSNNPGSAPARNVAIFFLGKEK